jgi:hypothetical protein
VQDRCWCDYYDDDVFDEDVTPYQLDDSVAQPFIDYTTVQKITAHSAIKCRVRQSGVG